MSVMSHRHGKLSHKDTSLPSFLVPCSPPGLHFIAQGGMNQRRPASSHAGPASHDELQQGLN